MDEVFNFFSSNDSKLLYLYKKFPTKKLLTAPLGVSIILHQSSAKIPSLGNDLLTKNENDITIINTKIFLSGDFICFIENILAFTLFQSNSFIFVASF